MKQTKAELLKINADLMQKLQMQTQVASQYHSQIRAMEDHISRMERRFDTLLEGMCMGMREANLPRRPA